MPKLQAVAVTLSEQQKKILTELQTGTHSQLHLKQRSEIILLAGSGETNSAIREKTGLSREPIKKWRKRYANAAVELAQVEIETPKKLRATIKSILSDEQRLGAPATFTEEQVACIIALSCENPTDLGLPFSHWTPSLLKEESIRRGIVPSISSMQIGRFLKRKRFKAALGERMAEPEDRRS